MYGEGMGTPRRGRNHLLTLLTSNLKGWKRTTRNISTHGRSLMPEAAASKYGALQLELNVLRNAEKILSETK
jgi:hypothetical protein